MEGPLVSDTTEVLSGAASASGESPIGQPAADLAATAPRSAGRSGGDLSKLLVSDLQRIAQELGISGTGRMRKGDLVAAITERTGGGRSAARAASSGGRASGTSSQSATRGSSAGADAPRPLNQDAMEADTTVRPGIGETAAAPGNGVAVERAGLGEAPAGGSRHGLGESVPAGQPSLSAPRDANGAAVNGTAATAEPATESGAEAPGQDSRRERSRSRSRRDEQGGGNGQRRESRESRDPAGSGRGQGAQGSAGSQNGGSRPDNRADSRPDNRADSRADSRADNRPDNRADDDDDRGGRRGRDRFRNRNRRRGDRQGGEPEAVIAEDDVLIPIAGILDVLENYAFVRTTGYLPGPNDVYVSLSQVRKHGLRKGDVIEGAVRQPRDGERREKFNALVRLDKVNGLDPEESLRRPEFSKLVPLYPQQRLRLETDPTNLATRIIDLISPIGKGQRGLIVSPPKAGKTMILQSIANAITKNNPECHLMVVLVDERPEEVTDMQRTVKGEVIHSTFDHPADDHTTVAELAIERAKRLAELGRDVVVMLDSLTRLGRAYNLAAPAGGRTLTGGVAVSALQPPRRFLGAARCLDEGGSLTILSTVLVDTSSALDSVLFEEFKGTGNMELRLRRDLAEKRIFPAIDPVPSGTRREELLMDPAEHAAVVTLRRMLAALDSQHAMELLLEKTTDSNQRLLAQVSATPPVRG